MLAKKLSHFGVVVHTYPSLEELILGIQHVPNIDSVIVEEYLYKSAELAIRTGFGAQLETKKIPLISTVLFSASVDNKQDENSFSLTKPIRRAELINTLYRALSGEKKATTVLPEEVIHTVRPISILLAEDNPTNQLVAKGLMRNLGYEIDIVDNGQRVLELVDQKFYDLILMDVQMPILDGLQTTQKLRMKVIAPKQPIIIAMTANASEEDKQVCLFSGMNDYLSKPVTRGEIIEKIENWFPEN